MSVSGRSRLVGEFSGNNLNSYASYLASVPSDESSGDHGVSPNERLVDMKKLLGLFICACVALVLGMGATGCSKKTEVKKDSKTTTTTTTTSPDKVVDEKKVEEKKVEVKGGEKKVEEKTTEEKKVEEKKVEEKKVEEKKVPEKKVEEKKTEEKKTSTTPEGKKVEEKKTEEKKTTEDKKSSSLSIRNDFFAQLDSNLLPLNRSEAVLVLASRASRNVAAVTA
jgi:FtsZ-interacting cell division protein ZipA